MWVWVFDVAWEGDGARVGRVIRAVVSWILTVTIAGGPRRTWRRNDTQADNNIRVALSQWTTTFTSKCSGSNRKRAAIKIWQSTNRWCERTKRIGGDPSKGHCAGRLGLTWSHPMRLVERKTKRRGQNWRLDVKRCKCSESWDRFAMYTSLYIKIPTPIGCNWKQLTPPLQRRSDKHTKKTNTDSSKARIMASNSIR
ncbi:hypothetical protein H4582DRAFT_2062680 [Lactarius indigo]|nr:hypothetical protein H4582DRAFT_2062680 [Lactarius indigo]